MNKYNLYQSEISWSSDTHVATPPNMKYPNFAFRFWLNGNFYNGFDDNVKSAMADISTQYTNYPQSTSYTFINGKIEQIDEKVKCPSITELGMTDKNVPSVYINEGSQYPIFSSFFSSDNYYYSDALITNNANSSRAVFYWTRSIIPDNSKNQCSNPAAVYPNYNNTTQYILYSCSSGSTSKRMANVQSIAHGSGRVYSGNDNAIVNIGLIAFIRF